MKGSFMRIWTVPLALLLAMSVLSACGGADQPKLDGEATVTNIAACLQESDLLDNVEITGDSITGDYLVAVFTDESKMSIMPYGSEAEAREEVEYVETNPGETVSELAPTPSVTLTFLTTELPSDEARSVAESCTTEA